MRFFFFRIKHQAKDTENNSKRFFLRNLVHSEHIYKIPQLLHFDRTV